MVSNRTGIVVGASSVEEALLNAHQQSSSNHGFDTLNAVLADEYGKSIRTMKLPLFFGDCLAGVIATKKESSSPAWVSKAGLVQFAEHLESLKQYPPIPTGALDPYEPPN